MRRGSLDHPSHPNGHPRRRRPRASDVVTNAHHYRAVVIVIIDLAEVKARRKHEADQRLRRERRQGHILLTLRERPHLFFGADYWLNQHLGSLEARDEMA